MPEPPLFLGPLYKEFEIMKKRILVEIPTIGGGTIFKMFKVILIAKAFYLPTWCLVLGNAWFNGKYGCVKCIYRGESFESVRGGNLHLSIQ